MPGRKPKPHHLKVVTGNPGKRPLGEAPPEVAGEVARPAVLAGRAPYLERARELWDQLAPTLVALRVLNPLTAHEFAAWCELMARYQAKPRAMTASMVAQMRALGSSYGLDAVSFERLLAGRGGPETNDPAQSYFGT